MSLKTNKLSLRNSHLQMDNARPHSATITQDYLTRNGVSVVHQAPYSPDLNLLDRYVFRAIKQDLKNDVFNGPEDVKTAIQRSIRLMSENTLMDQLKKLRDHCERVIEVNGDYVSQIH